MFLHSGTVLLVLAAASTSYAQATTVVPLKPVSQTKWISTLMPRTVLGGVQYTPGMVWVGLDACWWR